MSASVSTATPHLPTSPSDSGVVGVAAHERRQVEGGGQPVAAGGEDGPGSARFVSSGVPKPANIRIVHSLERYIEAWTPRV